MNRRRFAEEATRLAIETRATATPTEASEPAVCWSHGHAQSREDLESRRR